MKRIIKERKTERRSVSLRELGMLFFIILIAIVVQSINSNFLTLENIDDMIANAVVLSIMAAGMMMVIITRGIDLSVGATVALSGMISALAISRIEGFPPIAAVLLGILIGLAAGYIIGLLVAKLYVLPIIASLGMMNVYRGLTYIISGSKWVSAHEMPAAFKAIATNEILGIKAMIIIPIVIFIALYYYINHTRSGRRVYAVGSNPDSAVISGIKTDRVLIKVYMIMGALAGLAGVLWVAKYASAQGNTATGYELNVIAACVIGGVSISGGTGKVSGVVFGALLIGMLSNALPMVRISPFWQQAIQGVVILCSVIFNALVKLRIDKRNEMRRSI